MPSFEAVDGALRECHDCGLIQRVPALSRHSVARCPRCKAVLRRGRTDPSARALALCLTGLILFVLANRLDFMDLSVGGRVTDMTLISAPTKLGQYGMWQVAIVVFATTIVVPLIRLCCLATVLVGLRMRRVPRHLHVPFRWFVQLAPWSMIEIFMLGVFVAYTKLIDLADVHVGAAVYALGALMLAQVATDAVLDRETVWREIRRCNLVPRRDGALFRRRDGALVRRRDGALVRRRDGTANQRHVVADSPRPSADPRGLIGCECCHAVGPIVGDCARCGARMTRRKTGSMGRTAALLAAAAILYIPANMLPVMTYVRLGRAESNTIIGGVIELARSGMWPLALLVFFASITVPVLKLCGLGYLLLTTRARSRRRLLQRTLVFRVIEAIGRWSMIDVFMISILTALVRLGAIASVFPAPGVIAFCAVVIITMLATITFDPRVMWDVDRRAPPRLAPVGRAEPAGLAGVARG